MRIDRCLVLAPHADDEVLGVGGVLARYAHMGAECHIGVVTRPLSDEFSPDLLKIIEGEALEAHKVLGVAGTHFLDFPAASLDEVPHKELNSRVGDLVSKVRPDTVFIPHVGDLHKDHQVLFHSALVALRPFPGALVQRILAYETLSETNWNAPYLSHHFHPSVFVDIEAQLGVKLKAMECFSSQLKPFPNERSLEAIEVLARYRGATVGVRAAEAFTSIRSVVR
jgi:N-acetylglucosamine malate deacetylase 1